MMVDVVEVADSSILKAAGHAGHDRRAQGQVRPGTALPGIAVAHYGSNNMISFRYRLQDVPMKIAEKEFTADGIDVPGRLVRDHRHGAGGGRPRRRSRSSA